MMRLMVVLRCIFEHDHYTELTFKSFSLCNCSTYNSVQMYTFHLIYLSALPTYCDDLWPVQVQKWRLLLHMAYIEMLDFALCQPQDNNDVVVDVSDK